MVLQKASTFSIFPAAPLRRSGPRPDPGQHGTPLPRDQRARAVGALRPAHTGVPGRVQVPQGPRAGRLQALHGGHQVLDKVLHSK